MHASQHARVDVGEMLAIGEIEAQAVVIRILLPVSEVLEASGHAEVKGKPMAVVDFGEEMLAVTAGARKRSALERAGEVLRGGACEDLGRGDADALDLLVQGVSLQ